MWITDRMPDKEGVYIVRGKVILSQGEPPKKFVDCAEFLSWRSLPWLCVSDMDGVYDYEITGWMPLPSYD